MYDELMTKLLFCSKEINCSKCKWSYDCSGMKALIGEAFDAILKLQNQLKNCEMDNCHLMGRLSEEFFKHRWIPVTERFPKIDEQVLCWLFDECYIGGLGYCVDRENGQYKFINRVEWNFDEFCIGGEDFSNVTHWMPLPQQPESEGEI